MTEVIKIKLKWNIMKDEPKKPEKGLLKILIYKIDEPLFEHKYFITVEDVKTLLKELNEALEGESK